MKKVIRNVSWVAACVAMLTLSSCSKNDSAVADEATTTEAPAQDSAAAPEIQLNDAQIASAAVAANQIDVDYAEIALSKTQDPTIKNFAETMKKDHTAIIDAAVKLAGQLGVTPDDNNPLTQQLLDGAKDMKEKLNAASGADFDKIYIDNEAAFHDAVVGAVKTILIPQTQNEQLKSTLEGVMPLLEEHLKMAKEDAAKFDGQ